MALILSGIFFASGMSALIFETLWFHQAGLALGNGVWASALVLSGFMAGMGLGNALAFRFGDRIRNPIAAYALLELAIALTGLGLVKGLPHLGPALAPMLGPLQDVPILLGCVRLGFAFLFLLIPSTAMGMTLPLLTKALTRNERDFGRALGLLYGWNTLGAVAGVLLAEHWLLAALGISGTAWAAAAANLGAASLAGIIGWRSGIAESASSKATPSSAVPEPLSTSLGQHRWLVAAFVMGFSLLALEVIWFRMLALYAPGFSETLATMLAVVLCGMAIGGIAASSLSARLESAHRFAPLVAFASGTMLIVSYATLPIFTEQLGTRHAYSSVDVLLLSVPLMFPVALLSGLFYTVAGTAIRESAASETRAVGLLTLLNTSGAALGPLVAAFLLLPAIGAEMSMLLIALIYAGVGVLLMARSPRALRPGLVGAAGFALALVWFPFGTMNGELVRTAMERWSNGSETALVWLSEGPAETVIYLERRELGRHHSHRMLTNGFSMSSTSYQSRRYMKLYVYLPIALHPDPRSALLVSYGVGNTAKALTDTRALERIDVVDISANVLAASSVVYPNAEEHPLKDPRVSVHVEDGRYFMQTTEERYDLITSEPPPPRIAGVVNLYTREYFGLIRERLNEGGMLSYWLPVHSLTQSATLSIIRSFCDVYEDCSLWHGDRSDLMLLGSNDARVRVTEAQFVGQWRDDIVGPEMRRLGLEHPSQLGALFIGGPEYLSGLTRDALPLVDDHPKRIMAGFEFKETRSEIPLLGEWRRTELARERFRKSDVIARLWPEPLRRSSDEMFEIQALIERMGSAGGANLDEDVEVLHRILTETDLEIAVLWAIGSDSDIQRILETIPADGPRDPGVFFQRGALELAARRYTDAAAYYGLAALQPQLASDATRMQVFALCLAGKVDAARRLAESRHDGVGHQGPLPPFWRWMQARYGILPSTLASNANGP